MDVTPSMDESTLIEIDTVADWERIQSNFKDAMESILDTQLGTTATASERDALRQHLAAWHKRTFDLAKDNIRVNGVNLDEASGVQEMEPYDEALNFRVWGMDAERLAWDGTLAEHRQNDPRKLRELTEGILKYDRAAEYHPSPKSPDEEEMAIDPQPTLLNLAEIVDTYQQSISQSNDVQVRGPKLIERTSRALEVVQELSTLPA